MRLFGLLILMLMSFSVWAQCPSAERFIKNKDDRAGYDKNSQSRSAYIRSGEIFETVFICQGGYNYRFTIDTYGKNTGNLKYEVYELVVNKVEEDGKSVYRKEKNVLYSSLDNSSISIATEDSRKIHIKLLLESGNKETVECTGILVEYKKSKKIGF
jgi:hypothetical protein